MKIPPVTAPAHEPETAATAPAKIVIRKLPSGVRGLDEILGGGIPEYSFNLIAGMPGCGKTTMAHQIAFATGTESRPALYFTVLGEPALKMIRYQQQFSFYDPCKMGAAVRFISLSDTLIERDLDAVLEEIVRQVKALQPSTVFVDSFRAVERAAPLTISEGKILTFIQKLGQFLTSWEATSFLVGEYDREEIREHSLFNVVDGIFWLSQEVERNSVVRKLQIVKLRGQKSVPGLHTMRIDGDGVQAFSRTLGLLGRQAESATAFLRNKISIGIPKLDQMLNGGVYEGDSVLLAGPSGCGKSSLATQFIGEGLRQGESAIMAIFEERVQGYTNRADRFGLKFEASINNGKLEVLYLRLLDLSVDETMQQILDAIDRTGAKRLVIDSLGGFEMALAPSFRSDYRESLYRMIGVLTRAGVTILSTVEVEDSFSALSFSNYSISYLTDDIIRMRYVEISGQLRKVMVVIKMRGGNHSKDIREYIITDKGVELVAPRKTDYAALTSGLPTQGLQREELPPEPKRDGA